MSIFIKNVDRGRLGLNEGLPNGLQSINRYIYSTQKKRYYLLGGESGSGKTTALDSMFLFAPYEYMLANPGVEINFENYSFEQGRESKEASWASKIIHRKFGLRLPVAYIMSKGKNRVTDEHYQLCMQVAGYIDGMFQHMRMIDVPVTPSQFKADLFRYGAKHGTWKQRPLLDASGNVRKHSKTGRDLMEVYGWEPKNPEAHHIFLMDHIAYAAMEYSTLKQNIDTISRTIVFFREITNWTFAVLQQFNTELASVERQKFKKNAIAPQRVDFGDSRYTYQDADVVLGLMNPYAYDIPEFHGYNVARMEGYAIWMFLMKNRHDGPAARAIPHFMDPVAGTFEEIPEAMNAAVVELTGEDPLEPFYERAREFNDSISLYEG